jgi:protein-S-isoprenylcysteine O-methyltransferase Ste14/RimJ/RimL family protein N-acetyltransferase
MLARITIATYALLAYLTFLVSIVSAVGFLVDAAVPRVVDGAPSSSWPWAVAADVVLLGFFALHHSLMARARIKHLLTRVVPPAVERSTYVLLASGLLIATFALWQPLDATLWEVEPYPGRVLLWAIYAAGWLVVISSTFMIDHFELSGLRQAHTAATGRTPGAVAFKEAWLYAVVRHPMMLGLLIVLWATPRLTAGHLLFAAAASAYIAVGLAFEEHDLRAQLGTVYAEYAQRVPMLLPRLPRRRAKVPLGAAGQAGNGSPVSQTYGTTARLRGGVVADLRPLTPADRALYLAGFEHLSSESRQLRFFGPKPSLSEAEINYFIDVDHHDHEAIVATACGQGLGVARYIRDRFDPRTAEVAVAVVDDWQRRGVGTALLGRIAERAQEEKIDRLRAQVLPSNRAMLALIRRLPSDGIRRSWNDGVLNLEISLLCAECAA